MNFKFELGATVYYMDYQKIEPYIVESRLGKDYLDREQCDCYYTINGNGKCFDNLPEDKLFTTKAELLATL